MTGGCVGVLQLRLHLGLSEVDADVVERAHAVHPLTAVQSEYSLWTRDPERLLPTLRRLGIGLVVYRSASWWSAPATDPDPAATGRSRPALAETGSECVRG